MAQDKTTYTRNGKLYTRRKRDVLNDTKMTIRISKETLNNFKCRCEKDKTSYSKKIKAMINEYLVEGDNNV